jgi:hypothetical protein
VQNAKETAQAHWKHFGAAFGFEGRSILENIKAAKSEKSLKGLVSVV